MKRRKPKTVAYSHWVPVPAEVAKFPFALVPDEVLRRLIRVELAEARLLYQKVMG